MDTETRLRDLYEAFNSRDVDAVVAGMTDDVDWPNAWEGGRVVGPAGVRDYWRRQWAAIEPTVIPVAFTRRPDGRVAVEVEQLVLDLDGTELARGRVLHVYTLRDDLVARMDVEPNED
jgi:ketosteroid isomerase-like protein